MVSVAPDSRQRMRALHSSRAPGRRRIEQWSPKSAPHASKALNHRNPTSPSSSPCCCRSRAAREGETGARPALGCRAHARSRRGADPGVLNWTGSSMAGSINLAPMKLAVLFLSCLLPCGLALAQAYPSRPVKLVTPFPPGGSADVIARLTAAKLGEGLGQPVIVDNRPGAGGMVGNDYAAKQAPDGYTLLLITGAYPVQAAMLKSQPFDPLADIAMVSMLTTYPFVISVRPDSPLKTLADLVAAARANPGKLNYPSSGIGTVHHLSGELFNAMAGI